MRTRAPGENRSLSKANYFRLLLENTLDIVTVLQPNGTVVYANPATSRVLGFKPGTHPGKNIFDFIHPDDFEAVKKALDEIIKNPGAVCQVEFRHRHHDGSWRDIEALSRNLLDNPNIAAIVVNARDITPRKKAERALLKSEAALRKSHNQLAAVMARLLKVEEDELKRIAREIHDDLNQQLAASAVQVDQLIRNLPADREEICRCLRALETQLASIADDLHRMAYQLHPSMLEDLGLVPALRSYCRDLSKREGITISFEHQGTWKKLPSDLVLCIYRVSQEALRNVIKHSNADKAEVSLNRTQTGIKLRVRDCGKGFRQGVKKRGLGLLSMEERVRLAGGTFSLYSKPGDGTTVEVDFPIKG